MLKLVKTINEAVKKSGDRFLTDQILTTMFDTFWPRLETELTEIKNQREARTAPRSERELLEEMLEILRGQEQRVRKERGEKELGQAMSKLLTNVASVTVPTAVDMYLSFLQSSEKKVGDKRPSAPTEPFTKKKPSNVESREE